MRRLILATVLIVCAQSAAAQFLYPAKFVCGKAGSEQINAFYAAPGSYFTAINVRNAGTVPANIRKRFAQAKRDEQVGPLSTFFSATVPVANAMLIDCRNIWGHTGIPSGTFIEGFVEIRSNVELDVVGVYTAAPPDGGVSSIHTERVPKRP